MTSNRTILLCLPLLTAFFFGCSNDEALPSNYDELENRIENAAAKNDLDGLESLFYEMPQQWRNARPVAKEVLSALSKSGFTTRRVKFLHSPRTLNQSWSIEPEEFLRIEGIRDETEAISMGFHLGSFRGACHIIYPTTQDSKKPSAELTYHLMATDDVNLGEELPTTYEGSWSGRDAKSYSMDNLAAALSRFSGVAIINQTGIEGDYNFILKLNAAQDPCNIRLDLHSIGLDLVSKEPIQQVGARQPATRSESDSQGGDKPQPASEGRSR